MLQFERESVGIFFFLYEEDTFYSFFLMLSRTEYRSSADTVDALQIEIVGNLVRFSSRLFSGIFCTASKEMVSNIRWFYHLFYSTEGVFSR